MEAVLECRGLYFIRSLSFIPDPPKAAQGLQAHPRLPAFDAVCAFTFWVVMSVPIPTSHPRVPEGCEVPPLLLQSHPFPSFIDSVLESKAHLSSLLIQDV